MAVPITALMSASDVLAEHERIIEENQKSFTVSGAELRSIRDDKSYQDDYGTWDVYLKERWSGIGGRAHCYRLIAATEVMEALSPIGDILPLTETQARPLTKLTAEHQPVAWSRVLDAVGTAIDKITERLVSDIVEAYLRELRPESDNDGVETTGLYYTVAAWERLPEPERARIIADEPLGSTTKFNRTNDNVEWAYWTWNPVTGCDHGCNYCYARDLAQRYYTDLPEGERFAPVLRPRRLHAPRLMSVPDAYDPDDPETIGEKNVFVCSMADLFGKWVPQDWIDAVFTEVVNSPEWNYLFLTKFPQRLAEQRWPENAWCGTTVDRQTRVGTAERSFRGVTAGVKWLSCEPMLERLTFTSLEMFDWVVIGGSSRSSQTPEFQPPWEWIEHLTNQARAAGCKVYWKPNLKNRPREYPGVAQ
jgi:protein gp37